MRLDVGCGHRLTGDVNIDLYIEATPHRSQDQTKCDDFPLNVKEIPNFVRAHACFLPFINDSFEETFSRATIEHVSNPWLMLKEMVRVTKTNGRIIVQCPHRFASKKKKILHLHHLNLRFFEKAFYRLGLRDITGKYIHWKYFPHPFIPLVRIPTHIEIVARKTKG